MNQDTCHWLKLAVNKFNGLVPFSGSTALASWNTHSGHLHAVWIGLKRLEVTFSPKTNFSEISAFCLAWCYNNTWKQLAGVGSCLANFQFYKNVENVKALRNPATNVCTRCGQLAKFQGPYFSWQLRQETCINKVKYVFFIYDFFFFLFIQLA